MKAKFTIINLLVYTIFFAQTGISFEAPTSFKNILEKAKKEKKLIFVDAYAVWCGPCKMMDKNIFTDDDVKKYYDETFINAKFDMERGEGRELAAKYGVYSFPTYLFLNADGELVFKGLGYLDKNHFLELGKEANAMAVGGSSKERFEKGETDPDFLLNALKINARNDPEFAQKLAERYFNVRKNKEYSQEEVGILFNFIKSSEDELYRFFVKDKEEILKFFPEDSYNQFDIQLQMNTIVNHSVNLENKTINDAYFIQNASKLLPKEQVEKGLKQLKLNFYPALENFTEYEKIALEYYADGDNFSRQELDRAAFIFSEKINNLESLKKATIWAEKSIMKSENMENTYILAKLYLKIGKKQEAKMYAERSVALAKQEGRDASLPEQLLSEIN